MNNFSKEVNEFSVGKICRYFAAILFVLMFTALCSMGQPDEMILKVYASEVSLSGDEAAAAQAIQAAMATQLAQVAQISQNSAAANTVDITNVTSVPVVSEDATTAANVQAAQEIQAVTTVPTGVPAGISNEDYMALCKIVQAEAGGESQEGKLLVADVILNRVVNPAFPNSIQAVITQRGQFSPVSNGSYYSASPSADTIAAVNRALAGENISSGALYFKSVRSASSWSSRSFLFNFGNHNFYM